jgi:uncharacterized protein YjbI with pentapeptide repeats
VAVLEVMAITEDYENEAELREIPASEILDKIQKGEAIEYHHVRIMGDLDLSKLNLPTKHVDRTEHQIQKKWGLLELEAEGLLADCMIVSSSINISNSELRGVVNFRNCIFKMTTDFHGTTFSMNTYFRGAAFSGPDYFRGAMFSGIADFSGATFSGHANFSRSTFSGLANFSGSTFNGLADFSGATFSGLANFAGSIFSEIANFNGDTFYGICYFWEAMFSEDADFREAAFSGHADFSGTTFGWDGDFNGATFSRDAYYGGATFLGEVLTFKNSNFYHPESQESAFRKAKNVLERNGDREEAGYHFYREMDGKRKQKPWYYRYPEYVFIQLIFGYGVHPWRLMTWWGIIVAGFAAFYWIRSGINGATQLFDYTKFSLATAIAPGYIATIITPGSTGYTLAPEYQAVAIIESIFGTFLWAGFIATFARKYMR